MLRFEKEEEEKKKLLSESSLLTNVVELVVVFISANGWIQSFIPIKKENATT